MNSICQFGKCTLTDAQLLKLVDEKTDDMFRSQKIPTRHVPALPDEDYDLLIGELLLRFKAVVAQPAPTPCFTSEKDIDLTCPPITMTFNRVNE